MSTKSVLCIAVVACVGVSTAVRADPEKELSDEDRGQLENYVEFLDKSNRDPEMIEIRKDIVFERCRESGGSDDECRTVADGKKKGKKKKAEESSDTVEKDAAEVKADGCPPGLIC